MLKEHKTLVRFLVHPVNADLIAYFPQLNHCYNGYRNDLKVCYSHVGQHSSCAKEYALECREASREEYKDLLSELESIGYNNLRVLNK